MDIWSWTYKAQRELNEIGEHRLANAISEIPSLACDDEHEALDALYPEALASAKRLKLPWVELFIRHWHLQSRILHRMETQEFLGEAVNLLEFAHREETKDCPQSVCSTQDLTVAYQQRDHIGFVPERLSAAQETLDRIDPSWQCFECISNEYIGALVDAGRFDEAMASIQESAEQIHQACEPHIAKHRVNRLNCNKIDVLTGLGKQDEALSLALEEIDRLQESGSGSHQLQFRKLDAALLYAQRGEVEKSREILPRLQVIDKTPVYYPKAAKTLATMIEHGAMENTWHAGSILWSFALRLAQQGAIRHALEIAHQHAKLAVARGSALMAKESLALASSLLPKLQAPYSEGQDELNELEHAAAKLPLPEVGPWESLEQLYDLLPPNPEHALPLLMKAAIENPQEDAPLQMAAGAWKALGFENKALGLLRLAFEDSPSEARFDALAETLFDSRKFHELLALVQAHEEGPLQGISLWFGGLASRTLGEVEQATSYFERLVKEMPQHQGGLHFLAQMYQKQGRFEEALALTESRLEQEPSGADWERMVLATILGDWDKVRESAAKMDFEFESKEGPIDEPFEMCRVVHPDHPQDLYMAYRISPVTARILQLAPMEVSPNRHGEVVVIDPQPLNPIPEDHPEDEPYYFDFPIVHLLERSPMRPSFFLHGPYEQEEDLHALQARLREQGLVTERMSSPEYTMHDEQEDQSHTGVFFLLGVPEAMELAEAHQILTKELGKEKYPMQWRSLVAKMNDASELERQDAIWERFGMGSED